MELVTGDDLASRISAGPIAIPDALAIARQIALALEAAHEAGIVHRDLKPGNVKVRDDGTVKVLDFGLAKAPGHADSSADGSDSAVTSPAMTQLGIILGTAAYMSPEQAKGRPVTRRADVWAFGVVLYEMLTGKKLFAASDVSETLAAVLTREPDWKALPERTPPALRRLVSRCLVKDPQARLDSMGAARLEIDEAIDPPAASPAALASTSSKLMPAAIAAAALAAGALLAHWWWPASTGEDRSSRAPVVASIKAAPEAVSAYTHGFALSPDGATLVYVARTADGKRRLWKRPLADPRAEAIPGTDGAVYPFWSPDSRVVGFFANGSLKSVPIAGGPAQTITAAPGPWPRGSWNANGEILFSNGTLNSVLYRVSSAGGRTEEIPLGGPVDDPHWLPDGRHFLYLSGEAEPVKLMATSIDPAAPRVAVTEFAEGRDAGARFSDAGFLVFNRGGVLNRQRFDTTTMKLVGPLMAIGDKAGRPRGWLAVSVAGTTIVALNPPPDDMGGTPGDPVSRLQWVDRSGRVVGEIGVPARYWTMRLSLDGLMALANPDGYVWAIDARSTVKTRIASASGGVWMPDGRNVIYRTNDGLWLKSATGEGQPRSVVKFASRGLIPTSVSSDGLRVAVTARPDAKTPSQDIWLITIANGSTQPLLATEFEEEQASFSPDGKWIAYSSNSTGRMEVYVRAIDGQRPAAQVSTDGGEHPMWRRDGQELFFLSPTDEIVAVDMAPFARTGAPGARTTLFRIVLNDIIRENQPPFAVAPDGKRFLVNVPSAPEPLSLIHLAGK
jgi:eukaryotic-like serine/threonine-protein kinase